MNQFDPWLDAQALAAALKQPSAELVVIIGAEAWCEKCRTLRQAFEAFETSWACGSRIALWMDLEEHGEFIGDFVPEDLPLLLHYRQGVLIEAGIVAAMGTEGWQLRISIMPGTLPLDLWSSLTIGDWAP